MRLLDRTTRRVNLTSVGREFDRKVQALLDELDHTLLGIRGVAATRMGEVTIVVRAVDRLLLPVAGDLALPRALPEDPGEGLRRQRQRSAVGRGAQRGRLRAELCRRQGAGHRVRTLLEERFVAACRRDHPLAKKRRVRWTELAAYDYISVSKASGNRLLLDQALAGLPGRPQSIYETQHVTTMLGLVEAGLGVAAVPSIAMPDADHPLLVSVPLVDPVISAHRADAQGRTLSRRASNSTHSSRR